MVVFGMIIKKPTDTTSFVMIYYKPIYKYLTTRLYDIIKKNTLNFNLSQLILLLKKCGIHMLSNYYQFEIILNIHKN